MKNRKYNSLMPILKTIAIKLGVYEKITNLIREVRYSKSKQIILDEIQFRKFSRHVKYLDKEAFPESNKIVMIDGNDHEIIWAIRWSLMMLPLIRDGYHPVVLTQKTSAIQDKYYRLFGCKKFIYIDHFYRDKNLPEHILSEINTLFHSDDFKQRFLKYHFKDIPVGKITLSGYSRYQFRGHIDFNSPKELSQIKELFLRNLTYAYYVENFIADVPNIFITSEAFHDEHGIFYYYMLNKNVNVIKMNLSVMDDCVLIQKRNKENEGIHHNTITHKTFEAICEDQELNPKEVETFIEKNFSDRYSGKWHLSKRNHKNTKIADRETLISEYGLDPQKKIATIFSHILFDTLYFFEEELFDDYTEWLITSVECAIKNSNVNWLIKVHPSNIWRGEFISKFDYEEVRIIREHFGGELPDHVRLVLPSTRINPYSWIKYSDFGITVRGTIGMEMPCFGNYVITAASGRYTNLGFTIDPKTQSEYKKTLLNSHNIPEMTEEQIRLAKIYYYSVFAMKPFHLSLLKPVVRSGFKEVRLLGGLYSELKRNFYIGNTLYPNELENFAKWAERREVVDYVQSWEKYCRKT